MIAVANMILPIVIYSWWFIYFLDELVSKFKYRFNDKFISVSIWFRYNFIILLIKEFLKKSEFKNKINNAMTQLRVNNYKFEFIRRPCKKIF